MRIACGFIFVGPDIQFICCKTILPSALMEGSSLVEVMEILIFALQLIVASAGGTDTLCCCEKILAQMVKKAVFEVVDHFITRLGSRS
jgi:hypothetical protein